LKKQLLITFDYELFLGKRSGTVQQCLIKPTQMVLEVLEKHSIKHALFFVDTTYLLKLKEQNNPKSKEDLELVNGQLADILKRGHLVFPHLHPHWLDAKYLADVHQWDLSDITRYRLPVLDERLAQKLFGDSLDLISEVCRRANVNYSPDAYRAGGWCIQPFSYFEPLFLKFGIANDFSVLRGFKNSNSLCSYDFTEVPAADIYKFDREVSEKKEQGHFTEYTISSIGVKPLSKLLNKFLLKYLSLVKDLNFGNGISNNLSSDVDDDGNKGEMVAIELLTLAKLKSYLDYFRKNNYMHFISHPKMLSRHNIKMFDKFLYSVTRNYSVTTNYKTMIS